MLLNEDFYKEIFWVFIIGIDFDVNVIYDFGVIVSFILFYFIYFLVYLDRGGSLFCFYLGDYVGSNCCGMGKYVF